MNLPLFIHYSGQPFKQNPSQHHKPGIIAGVHHPTITWRNSDVNISIVSPFTAFVSLSPRLLRLLYHILHMVDSACTVCFWNLAENATIDPSRIFTVVIETISFHREVAFNCRRVGLQNHFFRLWSPAAKINISFPDSHAFSFIVPSRIRHSALILSHSNNPRIYV